MLPTNLRKLLKKHNRSVKFVWKNFIYLSLRGLEQAVAISIVLGLLAIGY